MKRYQNIFVRIALLLLPAFAFAQDKEAAIVLGFKTVDSNYVCTALVTSEGKPVKEVTVKLYVQRLFSLLPINEGTATDETGLASFTFPRDLPGDANGKLTVIAKIEDDENYGNAESKSEVAWGIVRPSSTTDKMERSLSASRERAPVYFMVASDLIIACIWGTLIYIIFQVFKIRKIRTIKK